MPTMHETTKNSSQRAKGYLSNCQDTKIFFELFVFLMFDIQRDLLFSKLFTCLDILDFFTFGFILLNSLKMLQGKIFCHGVSYVWNGNFPIEKIEWKYQSTDKENPQASLEARKGPMTKIVQQFTTISSEVASKTSQLVMRKYSCIFKQILRNNFGNLQNLVLSRLKLTFVEFLSFLDAQNLKSICLDHNNLTSPSIKAISKGKFPQLKRLKVDQNYIWSMQSFTRIQTKNLWKFQIEYFFKHHIQVNDLSFLFKIELANCDNFEQLYIRSKQRIRNQALLEAIKRKYNRLDIWSFEGD